MLVDPSLYEPIPENRHEINAGALLFPTAVPIVEGGQTSMDFIQEQGGDEDTFIFMFGLRPVYNLLGMRIEIVEGVFLSRKGPGFYPTWDIDQLMRETDLGGWRVVPTEEVLESWTDRVELRMNA